MINRVLFHEWGFRGNVEQFTDPMNSFIDKVLTRRKGIPISLSVLYLLVGERLGLPLEPVGLPGHFVVGCYADEAPSSSTPSTGAVSGRRRGLRPPALEHISPKPSDLAPTTSARCSAAAAATSPTTTPAGERLRPGADLLGICRRVRGDPRAVPAALNPSSRSPTSSAGRTSAPVWP